MDSGVVDDDVVSLPTHRVEDKLYQLRNVVHDLELLAVELVKENPTAACHNTLEEFEHLRIVSLRARIQRMQGASIRLREVFHSLCFTSAEGPLSRRPILVLQGDKHTALSFKRQRSNNEPLGITKVLEAVVVSEVEQRNLDRSFVHFKRKLHFLCRLLVEMTCIDRAEDLKQLLELEFELNFPLEIVDSKVSASLHVRHLISLVDQLGHERHRRVAIFSLAFRMQVVEQGFNLLLITLLNISEHLARVLDIINLKSVPEAHRSLNSGESRLRCHTLFHA